MINKSSLPIANIALIIALPEEQEYFHQVVSNRKDWTANTPRKRYFCHYESSAGEVEVTIETLTGMGNIEAIVGTSSVISVERPQLVIMVGIAGSLNPEEVGLGDVVVSNQAKLYASDKVAQFNSKIDKSYKLGTAADLVKAKRNGQTIVDIRDKFLNDSFFRYERKFVECEPMHKKLSEIEKELEKAPLKQLAVSELPEKFANIKSSSRNRKLHFGWLLASPHVVDSLEYRSYLVEKNSELSLDIHRQRGDHERVAWVKGELLAVDMESYGVLRAVEKARSVPDAEGGCADLYGAVIIRGISDLCEHKGDLDKNTKNSIRRLAAANATEVALTLIEAIDFVSLSREN